jgi:hypothetical protein
VLDNVCDASLVDVRSGVGLMANDQCLLSLVIELAARPGVLEQGIAKMLEDGLEFLPLDVGWLRCSA